MVVYVGESRTIVGESAWGDSRHTNTRHKDKLIYKRNIDCLKR